MLPIVMLGFLLAAGMIGWAGIIASTGRAARWVRIFYFGSVVVAAIAAYITTFHYIYYPNENTRFDGWPIPVVIFQRDSPADPWLDFIGPTVLFAFPMNFVLYAFLPSLIAFFLARRFSSPTPQKNA